MKNIINLSVFALLVIGVFLGTSTHVVMAQYDDFGYGDYGCCDGGYDDYGYDDYGYDDYGYDDYGYDDYGYDDYGYDDYGYDDYGYDDYGYDDYGYDDYGYDDYGYDDYGYDDYGYDDYGYDDYGYDDYGYDDYGYDDYGYDDYGYDDYGYDDYGYDDYGYDDYGYDDYGYDDYGYDDYGYDDYGEAYDSYRSSGVYGGGSNVNSRKTVNNNSRSVKNSSVKNSTVKKTTNVKTTNVKTVNNKYYYNEEKKYYYDKCKWEKCDPEPQRLICEYFRTSDNVVNKGDKVKLTWNTTGAKSAKISPDIGSVAVDGSKTVTITKDITYTLTIKNGNQSESCKVSIDVKSGSSSKTPRCEITATTKSLKYGNVTTLSWDTTYAEDIKLVDDDGKVLLDTKNMSNSEKKDLFDGSLKIKPAKTTTFTLFVDGDRKNAECSVTIGVYDEEVVHTGGGGDIVVYQEWQQQPYVSGVYLSEVPYTGVDAATAVKWSVGGIGSLWALYGAYMLAVRREFAFSDLLG